MSEIDWQSAAQVTNLPVRQTITGTLDYVLAARAGGFWRLAGRIEKWSSDRDQPQPYSGWYPWWEPATRELRRMSAACEDQDGNLVVGTLGSGLYWFDSKGQATRISKSQGLSNDYIFAVLVDREGDLWVGTDGGGLDRIKRHLFQVLEPTRGAVVQSVAADMEGGLWIGCNARPLTYWKDGVPRQMEAPVRSVLVDRQQRIWAGPPGPAGLLTVQNNRLRPVVGFDKTLQYVSAIHQDRRGWLWVGTQRGLARWDGTNWITFTTRDGLSADNISSLADDSAGNIWIGTDSGGLNCWRDGRITTIRKSPGGLPSDHVSSLYVDDSGAVWIGTDGGGLARLRAGKWTRYTQRDGLVSNSIGYLIDDGQGYLWIGSNAGLMRAARDDLDRFANGTTNLVPCRVYGRSDGLPIRECTFGTQPATCRAPDGKLWFSTIKGLVSVDPAALKPNTNPPPVRIEAVLIDGQVQQETTLRSDPITSLVVPAGKRHLEIQYGSLNLSAPERARFKYRLVGQQPDWFEAGSERVARYPNLPAGDYQFQVTACNEDGVWNPTGATLAFVLTPPFWRTGWFLGSSAALLLAAVAGVVHYLSTQRLQRQVLRLRQQEALEKERTRIARDIHDQLGASLTQVALLGELVESDKDAPGEVESHARQISQTARETTRVLDEIVWAVNPANDTLDGLMTYICKYTQEYLTVAGLHYRLKVPDQLPSTPLPPEVRHNVFLACKEAVTNVVRHANASEVWVRLRLESRAFALEIQDNGRGLDGLDQKAAQSRNGLRNMRKRMEDVGGEFGFAQVPEGGTLVRFSVPLTPPITGTAQ